jgi:hypothetical protein
MRLAGTWTPTRSDTDSFAFAPQTARSTPPRRWHWNPLGVGGPGPHSASRRLAGAAIPDRLHGADVRVRRLVGSCSLGQRGLVADEGAHHRCSGIRRRRHSRRGWMGRHTLLGARALPDLRPALDERSKVPVVRDRASRRGDVVQGGAVERLALVEPRADVGCAARNCSASDGPAHGARGCRLTNITWSSFSCGSDSSWAVSGGFDPCSIPAVVGRS